MLRILLIIVASILVILLLIVSYPYIRFKMTKPNKEANYKAVKIIGHRGAAGLAPENTLASVAKALEYNVDMIEIDIHLTADNEIVVIHDPNVKRTTNGKGEIENLELSEIKKLDAGSWFDQEYKGVKVPTLEEVIELVDGRTKLLIEIKWPKKGIYDGLVPELLKIIKERNAQSWVIIQSFEPEYLKEILTTNPDITCHQLLVVQSQYLPIYYDRRFRWGFFKPIDGVNSLNLYYLFISESLVKKYNSRNIQVGAYTVNEEEKMLKIASMGVSGIITDYPDKAISLLRE